ncbi:biopolymer transporter ExbD [Halovulum dunhuangense]|uniref:Biopolymer transporter ExbD n=1 Tax=Halovulum dunhuangense TaxID=1505036 RepID=A0A849L6J3_9RHOB|nr:biopolymer transporter ExbD [Halovulum dunhuangense]NNU82148.1 biopolymer transporter ExbD [Halovulum dunhuangense]
MRLADPSRRQPPESVVPMINVVFLLLIFFLMTAQIAPPEPFAVEPPQAEAGDPAGGDFTIYLAPDGTFAFRDVTGDEDALAALGSELEAYCTAGECSEAVPRPSVILRADQAVSGASVAALLPRLGAIGFASVQLVTVSP